ncbi:Putative glutamine amidotransferase [Evansella caseinilytica]|uniref:Putative glutamine amidotransferase n=1 Tax=Evansella caseinilytica TaxID=1503961 RepID=A0A1H3HET4_9BACI|nr:VWA domain-containing protein [Evansella caseinilytica]SDY13981.1 Putative glutamine amidotransferase [Evansella caseinilytica]
MGFELEQPLRLLLIIPALLLVALFLRTKLSLTKKQRNVIAIVRSVVLLLVILALAVPNVVLTTEHVHTVFVVDRSDSISDANAEMTAFIREAVAAKGPDDSFAIVSVGRDAAVERMLGAQTSFSSDWSKADTDYTNIEAGMQIASSLLSKEGAGRIVVLSDGNETVGDALQQAGMMKEQGIGVDVVPLYREKIKDVSLEEFNVPRQMFKGEQAALTLSVNSTEETAATVRILLNNEVVVQETVMLKEGTNSFRFNQPITETGMHRFRAEVLTDADSISENNQLSAMTVITGTPNVLLVEGEKQKAAPLYEALASTGLEITRITPDFLPTELNGYLQYQSIIFSNVSGTRIGESQMELIEKAVKDFGVGFIMTGGQDSFALGGYKDTPIERVLPVEMEIKSEEELPSLGLVFVIDRSGSMMGQRLELAKEAAARSVELLRVGDTVGVIAFDDQPWQIVETEEMTDIKEVTEKILGITDGGGTDIYPSLAEAYQQLAPLELQRKHIILLTDGESPETGSYQQLIEGGREEDNITLSTVAIGDGADHYLLDELAEYGDGRFYSVYDESTIPSILSRETMLTTRTYIEDEPFYPNVLNSTEWVHHFSNGVPQLNAYIATTPKGRSTGVLTSDKDDPVLSRWQYGLGKTVAWTSDAEGVWSGQWAAWENWPALWNDVVTWTFPADVQEPFQVSQKRNGTTNILTFTTEENQSRPLEATIVDEQGQMVDANIRMTAPGEYEVAFDGNEGMHYVQLTDLQQAPVFQTGITVAYPEEYRMKPTNESFLAALAGTGGGEVLDNGAAAFRPLAERPVSRQNIAPPLILTAFLLFFIEVALRRFGLPRFSGMLRRRQKEPASVSERAATIPTIRRMTRRSSRKQVQSNGIGDLKKMSVASQEKQRKQETKKAAKQQPKQEPPRADPGLNPSPTPGKRSTAAKVEAGAGSQETMKRLLEAKKRNRK